MSPTAANFIRGCWWYMNLPIERCREAVVFGAIRASYCRCGAVNVLNRTDGTAAGGVLTVYELQPDSTDKQLAERRGVLDGRGVVVHPVGRERA